MRRLIIVCLLTMAARYVLAQAPSYGISMPLYAGAYYLEAIVSHIDDVESWIEFDSRMSYINIKKDAMEIIVDGKPAFRNHYFQAPRCGAPLCMIFDEVHDTDCALFCYTPDTDSDSPRRFFIILRYPGRSLTYIYSAASFMAYENEAPAIPE